MLTAAWHAREGRHEHAALANLRASRFLHGPLGTLSARSVLEPSASASLPIDTRALVLRALARAILDDAPAPADVASADLEGADGVQSDSK
jgi:hypothetical protein